MSEELFLSAIEMLYQAALEPEAWGAFIDQFAKLINVPGGHYYLWDQELKGITFAIPSSYYSGELQAEAAAHWHCKDELFRRSLTRGGEWLLNDREFDKNYLARDAFHNEFLFQNDIYHVTGYRTTSTTSVSSAIGFLRGRDQKPMDAVEMAWLKRLEPHFETASRLHREMMRLKMSANMQEQALDTLDYPILLVYERGFVAFLNRAAEQWLSSNGAIGIKFQCLTGTDAQHQECLERLLRGALKNRVSGVKAIQRANGGKPDQMMVLPLNPLSQLGRIWERPIALIVVADPNAKTPLTAERLQVLFGLTAAEARVALGIAEGKTLDEIANEGNVSINTTRTQLKQALDKTGSRRQAELVKTVNTLPKIRNDHGQEK